jgi:hypothetical protein
MPARHLRGYIIALSALAWPGCKGGAIDSLPERMYEPRKASTPSSMPRPDAGPTEVRVEITKPAEDDVLAAASVAEVQALVQSRIQKSDDRSDDPIDPATVQFRLQATAGLREVVVGGVLLGPILKDQFSSRLDLSRAATGEYLLTVNASTRSGRRGMDTKLIKVDAGPRITIISPRQNGAYKRGVAVQVLVDSSPFEPNGTVEGFVGNTRIPLTATGVTNLYEAEIKFQEFDPPLSGEQAFRASAKNANGTGDEAQVQFLVDEEGPTFLATEPAPGAVVGGVIRVRARMSDPAGVVGPVIAVIGNKADVNFRMELKEEEGAAPGTFSTFFDTTKLTRCKPAPDKSICIVLPNISFRVADQLANESETAYDFAVDNHPPVLELDPPLMRVRKLDRQNRANLCSWAFDPVGNYQRPGDMPNDGCAVPQVFDLRARIEDDGNRAVGLKVVPIAGTDPRTTGLYILNKPTQPLVVDVDGDGVCDTINPKLIPTTTPAAGPSDVLLVRLTPIPPKGGGDFSPDPSLPALLPGAAPDATTCYRGGEPVTPPLCGAQSIPIAIGYWNALGPFPAIWAIEPITTRETLCLGSQFDAHANRIEENAWTCIAAAATDLNGNAGVSPPLRVWVDYDFQNVPGTGAGVCPMPPGAPNCTGTYVRQTDTVTSKPCTPRTFLGPGEARPEILLQGEGAAL